jgi:hypothetical protein
MLIVPDVQDVYTPLQTDVIVLLSEVSFKYFPAFRRLPDELITLFYFLMFGLTILLIGLLLLWLVPSTFRSTSRKHSYYVPK